MVALLLGKSHFLPREEDNGCARLITRKRGRKENGARLLWTGTLVYKETFPKKKRGGGGGGMFATISGKKTQFLETSGGLNFSRTKKRGGKGTSHSNCATWNAGRKGSFLNPLGEANFSRRGREMGTTSSRLWGSSERNRIRNRMKEERRARPAIARGEKGKGEGTFGLLMRVLFASQKRHERDYTADREKKRDFRTTTHQRNEKHFMLLGGKKPLRLREGPNSVTERNGVYFSTLSL